MGPAERKPAGGQGFAFRAAFLGLIALPVFLPLFTVDWFESHEAASYPARVVEVRRCWEDGMLSARWFPDLAGGRGYPFLSFYAPLSFWAAGLLHGPGMPAPLAWKIVVAFAAWAGAVGAYRLAREGTGPGGSLVAAALWAWAPYPLRDLWTRGDLAEYVALGLLPWALLATWRLRRVPGRRAVALAGLAGAVTILSHNVVGLLTGFALVGTAGLALAYRERSFRSVVACTAAGGGLALALSALFWVPALAEKQWVQLENLRQGIFEVSRNFVPLGDLVGISRPARVAAAGQAEPMSYELGVALFLALLAPWAWVKGGRGARGLLSLGGLLLAGGIFFTLAVSSFAYARVELLRFVGFPWRFLALASLGAALLGGAGVGVWIDRWPRAGIAVAAAIALFAGLSARDLARPLAELELQPWMLDPAAYRQADFTASVADEYLPVWATVPEEIPFRKGLAATGPAAFEDVERGVARWAFAVEAPTDVNVVLQDYFYPGWRATLDGRSVDVVPRPGSGHAQIACPSGRHEIRAKLEPTGVRRASAWLSALAAGTVLWLLRRPRAGSVSSRAS